MIVVIIGKTLEELNLVEGEVIDTKEFITEFIQGEHLEYASSLLYRLCAVYPELFNNPSLEVLLDETEVKKCIPNITKFIEEHLSLVYCSKSPNDIKLKLDDAYIEIEGRLLTQGASWYRTNPNAPVCSVLISDVLPLEGLENVLQPRIVKHSYDLKQLSRIMLRKCP
jgi:hypothetical protein